MLVQYPDCGKLEAMDISALISPEGLDQDGTETLRKLHIRSVEAFISRLADPNAQRALSGRLHLSPERLGALVEWACRLVPDFNPEATGPPVSRGALPPKPA